MSHCERLCALFNVVANSSVQELRDVQIILFQHHHMAVALYAVNPKLCQFDLSACLAYEFSRAVIVLRMTLGFANGN
jgi:hypothetical protein